MRKLLVLMLALIAVGLAAPSRVAAVTCNYNATTSTFAADIAAATAGQTVCLAAGAYGQFNGAAKTSPGVTVYAAPGVTASMYLYLANTSVTSAWLIFNGIAIDGAELGAPANNITIENGTLIDEMHFFQNAGNSACSGCAAMNNNNIVVNGVDVTMSADPQASGGGYQSAISFINAGSNDPHPAGVTIENSTFNTVCNDGIDIDSGGYGVTIGPGNVFNDIVQGSCENHADPIQFVGSDSPGPTITGNFFFNNSTGIAAYDYDNDGIITDNVVYDTTQDAIQVSGFDAASVVEHNTVVGLAIDCGVTNEGGACKAQIFNNIADGICVGTCGGGGTSGSGAPTVNDYNDCISGGCVGAHSVNGAPTFTGGSTPSTYAGYKLTTGSIGHAAANDGNDMGVVYSGGTPVTGIQNYLTYTFIP